MICTNCGHPRHQHYPTQRARRGRGHPSCHRLILDDARRVIGECKCRNFKRPPDETGEKGIRP